MNYKTHMLTSFTGAVALSQVVDLPLGMAFTVGVFVGSILPDIDAPTSKMGRATSVEVWKGRKGKSIRFGLSTVVNKVFGHRGFTHSIIAIAFLSLLLLAWTYPIVYGLILGYALHIAGDFFSKRGVPLLYPFTKKRFKFHLYTTDTWSETVVFAVTLVALYLLVDETMVQWFI